MNCVWSATCAWLSPLSTPSLGNRVHEGNYAIADDHWMYSAYFVQSIINCRWRHSRWGGRATFSAGSLHSQCPLFKGASCRVHNGLWRWQWPILNHLEATAGIEMLTCYTNALWLNKEVTSFILMLHVHPHLSQFPAPHTPEVEVKSATLSINLLSNNTESTTKFIYVTLRETR
jgi:hypothetical protein